MIAKWQEELMRAADSRKIEILSRFFKTGKGEYGEGDVFVGIKVPDNRAVSKNYCDASLEKISEMLASPVHEFRLAALLALVAKYKKAKSRSEKSDICDYYINICHLANNWDLVDLSAPYILGAELAAGFHGDTIYRLSDSECLWERRTAVVATLMAIRQGKLEPALEICHTLIADSHVLIQKATGWVLREVGKKDTDTLRQFLDRHIGNISTVTLSYATEKLAPCERSFWRNMRKLQKNS